MNNALSRHAETRAQQRGIPPLMIDLVRKYGCREYDHRGGVVRLLDREAKRAVERNIGAQIARRLNEYYDVYVVEDAVNGHIITCGRRYKRVYRC